MFQPSAVEVPSNIISRIKDSVALVDCRGLSFSSSSRLEVAFVFYSALYVFQVILVCKVSIELRSFREWLVVASGGDSNICLVCYICIRVCTHICARLEMICGMVAVGLLC